jgi:hypothetical protein
VTKLLSAREPESSLRLPCFHTDFTGANATRAHYELPRSLLAQPLSRSLLSRSRGHGRTAGDAEGHPGPYLCAAFAAVALLAGPLCHYSSPTSRTWATHAPGCERVMCGRLGDRWSMVDHNPYRKYGTEVSVGTSRDEDDHLPRPRSVSCKAVAEKPPK